MVGTAKQPVFVNSKILYQKTSHISQKTFHISQKTFHFLG